MSEDVEEDNVGQVEVNYGALSWLTALLILNRGKQRPSYTLSRAGGATKIQNPKLDGLLWDVRYRIDPCRRAGKGDSDGAAVDEEYDVLFEICFLSSQ